MKELLRQELEFFGDIDNIDGKPVVTSSDKTIAFVRAQSKSLLVENGQQAMESLLSSTRIYGDLILSFLEDNFELELILRKWDSVSEFFLSNNGNSNFGGFRVLELN